MTKEQQIIELLLQLTPNQQDFFRRLYPNMPSKKQQDHAIRQINSTMFNNSEHNVNAEKLKALQGQLDLITSQFKESQDHLNGALDELKELKLEMAEKDLEPAKDNDSAKRLLKLHYLEDAGVDNWSGYDYAIELYEKSLLKN